MSRWMAIVRLTEWIVEEARSYILWIWENQRETSREKQSIRDVQIEIYSKFPLLVVNHRRDKRSPRNAKPNITLSTTKSGEFRYDVHMPHGVCFKIRLCMWVR